MENNKEVKKDDQHIKMIKETIFLTFLFLKSNKSDIELSKITGISSSTIGRRLTSKELFLEAFKDRGEEFFNKVASRRQENLQRGKIIGGQTSKMNNRPLRDENGHLNGNISRNNDFRLDIFYKEENLQLKILSHMILTFRLKLDTLSELFNINEEELKEKLYKLNPNFYYYFDYLFYHDFTDQILAKELFIHFYHEYLNAIRTKDEQKRIELLKIITDIDAKEVIDRHSKGQKIITDEEMGIMINYQLKYGLSNLETACTFDIDRRNYNKRVKEYLEDKPDLKVRHDSLIDFKKSLYQKGKYGRR